MKHLLGSALITFAGKCGFELRRKPKHQSDFPRDFDAAAVDTIRRVKPYTMTCDEKIFCLISAVRYIVTNNIVGDFVECGVFRGGSVMTMAKTLLELGVTDRKIHLYDTFSGMPQPASVDVSSAGKVATEVFENTKIARDSSSWVNAPLEEVRANLSRIPYPKKNFVFVKGKVEDTLPSSTPELISLLRLDTDLYSSTKTEMEFLFPRLMRGGVAIFDDYGHWLGSRRAIDEYFAEHHTQIFLNRIDFSGRVAVKQ